MGPLEVHGALLTAEPYLLPPKLLQFYIVTECSKRPTESVFDAMVLRPAAVFPQMTAAAVLF